MVDLDEDRIGNAFVDAFFQNFGVGHKQIVTHDLNFLAQTVCEHFPTVPVVFGHAVFDADDGVLVDPRGQHVDPLLTCQRQAFAFEFVFAVFVKLTGSAVKANGYLLAWGVARCSDGIQNHLDGSFVVGHVGGKATFVAHGNAHAFVVNDFFQGVKNFCTVTHRFTEAGRTHGDDHQFLQIEVVVRMGAAVDDVHHGDGQLASVHAAKVTVQGQARLFSSGTGHGHGHGQHGVGAQTAFVVSAV